jgi:hypothetical protein
MKTIQINLFSFNELSEEAKIEALKENYNVNEHSLYFYYEEAKQSIRKFNALFDIQESRHNFLDYSISHIDDNILELSNDRLKKFIANKIDIEKYQDCPLTGLCYDITLLFPFYRPDENQSLEDCIKLAYTAIVKELKENEDYLYSDKSIIEHFNNNDYYFFENGQSYES